MSEPEGTQETFISHLVELRTRLLRSIVAVVVALVCLFPWAKDIYALLAAPLVLRTRFPGTAWAASVADVLTQHVGRLIWNGYPTGVTVVAAPVWRAREDVQFSRHDDELAPRTFPACRRAGLGRRRSARPLRRVLRWPRVAHRSRAAAR